DRAAGWPGAGAPDPAGCSARRPASGGVPHRDPSPVPDRRWTPGAGLPVLDSRCWTPGAGLPVLDSRCAATMGPGNGRYAAGCHRRPAGLAASPRLVRYAPGETPNSRLNAFDSEALLAYPVRLAIASRLRSPVVR